MIIAILSLATASAQECRVVTDDVIRMSDVAAASPAFMSTESQEVVSYSPLPGAVRILQAAQLASLAHRHGITGDDFQDVCFQRAMRQLHERELLEACRQALDIPSAEVELVDFSRFPAPAGDLVFPRAGLTFTPSNVPMLWKGYVVYGSGNRFPVWVRLKIRARLNRVVATDHLVTSKPVRADQVRIERLDGVPDVLAPAQSLDQVVGKKLLRPLRSGATVSLDDIATVIAIRRGDRVDVDFDSGGVRLRLEATAEMDGRFGDRIRLRNLENNNTFVAEVAGRNQARVVLNEEMKDETNGRGAALRPPGKSGGNCQKETQEGCPSVGP